MGIGPFTTYAPPGVYSQTVVEPNAGQALAGLRIPVLIGPSRETLSQTNFEMVRGSSSQADTPIFGEDISSRWVVSGPNNNPVLGPTDGNKTRFRVRNYPIVDGSGAGKVTYDSSKVSVTVNGSPAAVTAVDGPNGVVTLLVPPGETDFVTVNYYFHRKDTRITDIVSDQVSDGPAVLISPLAEPYSVGASNNVLIVQVNDQTTPFSITLITGTTRSAADVAADINAASVPGLTANVILDNQGLSHLFLTASGNVYVSSGTANGPLGFNFGDYTNRNKSFVVFNGPIVDGSDGGVTTTDPSKVVVKVNNVQVLARAVDGANRTVTLAAAPPAGSIVSVEYWFNSWQDTFDYLPNSNVTQVDGVGQSLSSSGPPTGYINGLDYIVVNDLDQSKIQWGTSFTVASGLKNGSTALDSAQILGMLVDDRIFGVELDRYVDTTNATVSTSKFTMPITPTTGNGRDTPLNISVFNAITNGRMDLPTDNPNLVTVYVGKTWRDAYARGPVVVTEVDGMSNLVTLRDPVPADYKAYATFWYNRISDDTYTFSVVTPGPTGVGQYTIKSTLTNELQYGVRFGSKSGLPETIQWPSGSETYPDAFIFGGAPVAETVTVTFDNALQPARHASITNANPQPYDIYSASSSFGNIIVDGNAPFAVNLQTGFTAQMMGSPVTDPSSFLATDRLQLEIDGVSIQVDVSASLSMADVVTAINAAVDADTTVHDDTSGTFFSTAPNNLASVVSYGSEVILKVVGRNLNSTPDLHYISSVKVQIPTGVGLTDASAAVGLTTNEVSLGSYDGMNQAAFVAGTLAEPFAINSSINDRLVLNVDGVDFQATLPGGAAITTQQVVDAINDAYLPFAGTANQATVLADLISIANSLSTSYTAHIGSSVFHDTADAVNLVTAPAASDLPTLIALINDVKTVFNLHIVNDGGVYHNLADGVNGVTAADATDLITAAILTNQLRTRFNAHLIQFGVHGHDDVTNTEVSPDADVLTVTNAADDGSGLVQITTSTLHGLSNGDQVYITGVVGTTEANSTNPGDWTVAVVDGFNFTLTGSTYTNAYVSGGTVYTFTKMTTLLNSLKASFNSHLIESGVHLTNDLSNTVTAANITTDDVAGLWTESAALANAIKASFNLHIADTTYHWVSDTSNAVATANAVNSNAPSVFALANALKAAFNGHLLQTQGVYHVHGTTDSTNGVSTTTTALVAKVGSELYAGKVLLTSLVNTPNSAVIIRSSSTATVVLGLTLGAVVGRSQPTASRLAAALNYDGTFSASAVAWPLAVQGLGTYLRIDSLTSGIFSTLSFTSTANTTFIPSTNIGIVPGSTSDIGENAVAGYTVASSTPGGSSGVGTVGQTYTDAATGLRFTVLPASAGDYSTGGSFTLVVGQTFTCDSALPIRSVPGVEVTVTNTVGTLPETTALLKTYKRTGNEPPVGAIYYISYQYAKTSYDTQLFQDLRRIQQSFGPPSPDFPLSLAARLAILNGAVLVGLKQVVKDPNTGNATIGGYINAIDDLKKPISGNIKPDVITPLGTDPSIMAYLNQHCAFMSSPRQEGERVGVVGTAIGTTPLGVQAIAKGLQSELMVVVYPDSYVLTIQDDAGNLTDRLVDGTYVAASLAGTMCSPAIDVATPLTRRQISGFKRIGRVLDPTEANQVAVSGVSVMEQVDANIRVRHGLTTRMDNVITRTPSVTLTIHYVQQTMRAVLDPYIGQKFVASIPKQVEQSMAAAFQRMINAQIVAKVSGIVANVDENDPTILRVEAIYVPVFPLEYIVASLSIRIRS